MYQGLEGTMQGHCIINYILSYLNSEAFLPRISVPEASMQTGKLNLILYSVVMLIIRTMLYANQVVKLTLFSGLQNGIRTPAPKTK